MKIVQTVVDNSTTVLGALTALFGLLTAFGLELTSEQVGAVMTFAGAIIAVLSAWATTAKRKVVTSVDNDGVIRAGAASTTETGQATPVIRDPSTGNLIPQVAVKPDLLAA